MRLVFQNRLHKISPTVGAQGADVVSVVAVASPEQDRPVGTGAPCARVEGIVVAAPEN
jgi:hypothetical protein